MTLKPLKHQIDDTIELCWERVEKNERVPVKTLTKRTAERSDGLSYSSSGWDLLCSAWALHQRGPIHFSVVSTGEFTSQIAARSGW
jgi:hypothetical protein